MRLLSTTDLHENREYYAQLIKGGKIRRIRLLGVVNTYPKPEICFQVIKQKRSDYVDYNFFGLNEIGIGTTSEEAEFNYGKLIDSKMPTIYNSDQEIEVFLKKIEMAQNQFEYYNYRNVRELI
ncbi:MAG: hypothetical protein RL308_101 [Bacteroidota bacterium]|jgi:hypothetical protein